MAVIKVCYRIIVKCCHIIVCCPRTCVSFCCRSCSCSSYIGRRFAALYVITFFFILPSLLRTVPQSAFYSQGNKTMVERSLKAANNQRLAAADGYFASLNNTNRSHVRVSTNRTSHHTVNVALTIITVSRNRHRIDSYEPRYLTQVVWKYLALLDKQKSRFSLKLDMRTQIAICNVDHDVASYGEALALSQFVPMFSRFNKTYFSILHTLEKEKQDYVFCLNHSLYYGAMKPDYVFLVEDDALPTDDLFDVLQHVLEVHTEESYTRGELRSVPNNIAYIKFYHPERLLNFVSLQPERIPELVAYTVLLSAFLTAISVVMCHVLEKADGISIHVLWRRLAVFSLLVVLSCGRTGMSEWRRVASPAFYSYTPAPSCCTPAMLFLRESAQVVVDYLNATTCQNNFGKDSVLDSMIAEKKLNAYLVQPNTFTHIGLYSSLREQMVDPFLV